MGCFYFVNAVLPLDKVLESKWLAVNPVLLGRTPFALPGTEIVEDEDIQKTCACGNTFLPTNNKQKYCPSCRRKSRRNRVRKHRGKQRSN